jgi:hypothetical protein
MRKNITFAIVATIMGLSMIVWAKSSVVTTHAEVIRPKAGSSPYVVMSNSYLPIQLIEEVY